MINNTIPLILPFTLPTDISTSPFDKLAQSDIQGLYGVIQLKANAQLCMTVRRSSDDAIKDIGFSQGIVDIASIMAFIGSSSGYVKTLYDQSGNGYHLTQITLANQPRIVNSGILDVDANNIPTLFFDGTNDILFNANISMSNICTTFSIIKTNVIDATSRRFVCLSDSVNGNSNNFNGFNIGSTNVTGEGLRFPENQAPNKTLSLATKRLVSYRRTSTTYQEISIDNGTITTNTNSTTTFSANKITLGAMFISGSDDFFWSGNISAFAVCNTITSEQKITIERYLASKFIITLS
jgi:hypothetical protein